MKLFYKIFVFGFIMLCQPATGNSLPDPQLMVDTLETAYYAIKPCRRDVVDGTNFLDSSNCLILKSSVNSYYEMVDQLAETHTPVLTHISKNLSIRQQGKYVGYIPKVEQAVEVFHLKSN